MVSIGLSLGRKGKEMELEAVAAGVETERKLSFTRSKA